MKKLCSLVAFATMLIGFASCEKVEPTALETADLNASKISGYVYYTKLDDGGASEGIKVFEGKANVNIEVTELNAEGKATGNVMLVTSALKAGKYEAKIPVAVGKKAKCKVSCLFVQENYDLKTASDGADYKKTQVTYKGESEKTISYGETLYVELQGVKVGSLDDPYHF